MKSLQEAYNSIYLQEVDVNIYEEAYQCLLEQGYEDNDAIEVVNYFYENNSLEGMLCENKLKFAKGILDMARMLGGMTGVWKPSAAAMRKASGVKGAASRILQGTGSKATKAPKPKPTPKPTASKPKPKPTASKPKPKPTASKPKPRGAAANPWNQFPKKTTPAKLSSDAYPSSPVKGRLLPAWGKTTRTPIPTPKETGGPLGVRSVPNIKQVSAKYGVDAPAPKPAWGGKPGNPWTAPDTRIIKAPKVSKVQPKPSTKSQPALPGTASQKALPSAGQTSSRRSTAAANLRSASSGTKGSDVKQGMTSAIVKRNPSLSDKVKNVMKSRRAKELAGVAAGIGLATSNLSKNKDIKVSKEADTSATSSAPTPKPTPASTKTTPTTSSAPTPKPTPAPTKTTPTTPAPRKASTKTTPTTTPVPRKAPTSKTYSKKSDIDSVTKKSTPKNTALSTPSKKKMTKIDRDVEELMRMRAASMARQGREKESSELYDKIKKRYGK